MKVGRCAEGANTFWAVIDEPAATATPLAGTFSEWAGAAVGGSPLSIAGESKPLGAINLLAPLEPGSKIVCIGLNYRSHVEAFGRTMPAAPVAFLKAPTAMIGPGDDLKHSSLTEMLDYEIELVVVIGRERTASSPCAALGYTVGNDVSARDLQRAGERGPDLYSAKSLDDTCPIGPWITTADEVGSAPDLEMTLRVNGETRQSARTSTMHWPVLELLAYADARTRLLPGDLVFTGTPHGVALEDGRYLKPGDVVETSIEGIGALTNTVVCA